MAYAAIHIPEFPAAAWLRLDPSAKAHAAAVVEGTAPLERIVSFNSAAKHLGLTQGMSKVQAETSGRLLFHTRSVSEEKAALDLVFEAAERFSPRVQVVASPVNAYGQATQLAASLLLDQGGMETLFGNADNFAQKLHEALGELGFPANVAVAPNAEASLLLSRTYAGASYTTEADVRKRLSVLPVTVLRCEAATLSILVRWGLRTLGELASLPETGLVSRIGQEGRRLQRLAAGIEDHLLVPQEPAFVLSDCVMLDSPLQSLESLLFLVSPLLDKLLKQAVSHAYAVRSVTVTLALEKLVPHEVVVKPAVPVQSWELLLKLLNLKLQADPPQAGIMAVTVTAEPAIPQVAQHGLFQARFPEPGKLDLLIARLKALVGENNVGSPALVNSHRDDEFTMLPYQPSATGTSARPVHRAVRPALRRFRPLQPARVRLNGVNPAFVFWKGDRFEVTGITGPWQSSGYWWDGRSWAAEEWDAVLSGPRHVVRLRHEVQTDVWFVAGLYD